MLRRLTACALVPRAWLTKRAFCIIAAPPRLTAQGRGACNYKPPTVQNGRFVQSASRLYAASNIVRRARVRRCRAARFRALRGALPARHLSASAEMPRRRESRRSVQNIRFSTAFQHPPAPRSRGGRRTQRGDEKRAPSQAWKLFSLAYRPDKCQTAHLGCLGRRSGFTSSVSFIQHFTIGACVCQAFWRNSRRFSRNRTN